MCCQSPTWNVICVLSISSLECHLQALSISSLECHLQALSITYLECHLQALSVVVTLLQCLYISFFFLPLVFLTLGW